MDCKEFREELDLYVDDELSAAAFMAARAHLDECSACRRAMKNLLRLRSNLKLSVSQHRPPADLVTAVRAITKTGRARNPDSQTGSTESGLRPGRASWKGGIRLPVPVFAMLLTAMIGFGILFMAKVFRPEERVRNVTTPTQSERSQSANEADYFSRFDHGGRASLYKLPR